LKFETLYEVSLRLHATRLHAEGKPSDNANANVCQYIAEAPDAEEAIKTAKWLNSHIIELTDPFDKVTRKYRTNSVTVMSVRRATELPLGKEVACWYPNDPPAVEDDKPNHAAMVTAAPAPSDGRGGEIIVVSRPMGVQTLGPEGVENIRNGIKAQLGDDVRVVVLQEGMTFRRA
jgi:hypothetical protein